MIVPYKSGKSDVNISFKNSLKKWLECDRILDENKEKNKKIKEFKSNLSTSIAKCLENDRKEESEIRIASRGIIIKYKKTVRKKPITKSYIKESLENYLENTEYKNGDYANRILSILYSPKERLLVSIVAATGMDEDLARKMANYVYDNREEIVTVGIKKKKIRGD